MEEIAKTEAWIVANPEQAAGVIAPLVGLDSDIVLRGIKRRHYGAEPVTDEFLDSQQKIADALHSIGLIPRPIQVREASLK